MNDPRAGALRQIHRAEVLVFLSVRLIHVGQGVISVGTASSAYHPKRLAIMVLLVMTAESAWVARRDVRTGAHLSSTAIVDTVVSLVGLVALGLATLPSDRTTSLNWMLPYSVGAAAGLALSMPMYAGRY